MILFARLIVRSKWPQYEKRDTPQKDLFLVLTIGPLPIPFFMQQFNFENIP